MKEATGVNWYNKEEQSGKLSPVELATLFHYRYIRIHPFEDGNGRIARLMVNYILARHASRRPAHQGGTFILYTMSVTTYSNKPLSISDIITMLRDSRGLIFQDEDYAKNQLEIIGYFRIANYLRL